MPRRLPEDLTKVAEFAEFTVHSWRDLDAFYSYWVNRWKRTLDFIRGDHWNILKQVDRDKLPAWKRYPRINYTRKFYEDFLRQWLQARVRYSAVPASPDPSDISASELAETVLKYSWDITRMEAKRMDLGAWLMSCGTSYLRYYWDTDTGNMLPLAVPTPDGGMLPVNPDTLEIDPTMLQPEMVDKGELGAEVISPQLVRWGHSEKDGVMIGMLLSFDEAASLYGADTAGKLQYSGAHTGISQDISFGNNPGQDNPMMERTLVIQHYIPRSARYPNGLWWTASENMQLLTRPNPLPAGIIPIATFRWIPVPGHRKLGYSPLYDITFSNKSYDERMARIQEWQNKVIPKYLLMNGGGISYGEINDEPGQELVVNPGAEPKVMEFRQAPSTFFQLLQTDVTDMLSLGGYDLPGTPEPGKGQVLPGSRLRMPIEGPSADQTALAQINAKAGWIEAGEAVIAYASTFYSEPRIIAIQGPDRQYQWQEFVGTDLANLAATIHVDETSLYPWSRQELRETVIGLMSTDFGAVLLMDEDGAVDKDRLNAILNATGLDVSVDAYDSDIAEARNEQMLFKNFQEGGDPSTLPQPQFWQDHAKHYAEHVKPLKGNTFKSWPPAGQQAYLQHVEATGQILNEQAQEEAQAMIQQEQALRQVREDVETQANIREMVAQMVMEIVEPVLQDALNVTPEESVTEEEE